PRLIGLFQQHHTGSALAVRILHSVETVAGPDPRQPRRKLTERMPEQPLIVVVAQLPLDGFFVAAAATLQIGAGPAVTLHRLHEIGRAHRAAAPRTRPRSRFRWQL